MKFWAFILAIQLCAISVEPTVVQAFAQMSHGKSCCDNSCHNTTSKGKPFSCPINCPNNGTCKVCFSPVGAYTMSATLRFKLFIPQASRPAATTEDQLMFDHLTDCFHPPELV